MPLRRSAAAAIIQRAIRRKLARKKLFKKSTKAIKKAGGVYAFKRRVAFRYGKYGVNRGRRSAYF